MADQIPLKASTGATPHPTTFGTGDTLGVAHGGTSSTSLAAHSVLVGAGTSPLTLVAPVQAGYVLTDNGPGNDPSFKAAPSTAPGGSSGQIQYNNGGTFAGVTLGSGLTFSGGVLSATGGGGGGASAPLVSGEISPPNILADSQGQTITVPLGSTTPYPSTRIPDYLLITTFAALPASPNIAPGSTVIARCTDNNHNYIWTGAAWSQI